MTAPSHGGPVEAPPLLRRLARPLMSLVVVPAVLAAFVLTHPSALGLGGYVLMAFLVIVWNTFALKGALATRALPLRGLLRPDNLLIVSCYVIVWVVWGLYVRQLWTYHRALYSLGYALAALAAVAVVVARPEARRLRNYVIVLYDVVGTIALAAWALADSGSDGGAAVDAFAQGWGFTQLLLFSWGAYFAPIMFLPPLLPIEPRPTEPLAGGLSVLGDGTLVVAGGPDAAAAPLPARPPSVEAGAGAGPPRRPAARRRGPVRRAASVGLDGALVTIVAMLVVLSALGVGNISRWEDLKVPDPSTLPVRPGFQFAVVGRAFTDVEEPVSGWPRVVATEVARAKELGLDYIRYDLYSELLAKEEDLGRLDVAVATIRAAGLDVILSPYGSGRWEGDHPSFEGLVERIRNDTLLLVDRYEPAWVFPFFGPNGQVAVNLGRMAPVADWAAAIDSLGREVRAHSNSTRVLIEVVVEPQQGLDLVRALSAPGMSIDAIGVDIYPANPSDLGVLPRYREAATNASLGFWMSEYGMESVVFGQRAQSRAIVTAVSRAAGVLECTGLCIWTLLDDTVVPSNMGLVGRDGEPKEAFGALKTAIAAVRGPGGG